MTNEIFKASFGTDEASLMGAILKVHDAAPNADKRAWRLLLKATEAAALDDTEPNMSLLAGALYDAARGRLNDMVSSVQGAEGVLTHEQAVAAVAKTDVGLALREIIDMADEASITASSLAKSVEASLSRKDAERRLFDRARELQIEKAGEGIPVSLLTAVEIAKAEA